MLKNAPNLIYVEIPLKCGQFCEWKLRRLEAGMSNAKSNVDDFIGRGCGLRAKLSLRFSEKNQISDNLA